MLRSLSEDTDSRDRSVGMSGEFAAPDTSGERPPSSRAECQRWAVRVFGGVEVADQGGTWAPGVNSRSENGRGLLVVFTLARACGITGDGSGRVAWFELGCP